MKKVVTLAAAVVTGAAIAVALIFMLWPSPEVRTCSEWANSSELKLMCVFSDVGDEEITYDEYEKAIEGATDSIDEFIDELTNY